MLYFRIITRYGGKDHMTDWASAEDVYVEDLARVTNSLLDFKIEYKEV